MIYIYPDDQGAGEQATSGKWIWFFMVYLRCVDGLWKSTYNGNINHVFDHRDGLRCVK